MFNNVKKFIILFFLLFPGICSADFHEVFINTDPVGAEVKLDYQPLGKTPVRVVLEQKKKYLMEIEAEGYHQFSTEKFLGEKRREVLFFTLKPEKVNIVIEHKNEELYINGVTAGKTPVMITGLPDGFYRIESNESGIHLWVGDGWETRRESLVDLFFSSSILGLSVTGFVLNDDRDYEKEIFFKSSALIFGIISGYNFMKFLKSHFEYRSQFNDFYNVDVKPYNVNDAKSNFVKGMELLGNGNYKEAIPYFNLISELYPDSEYLPISIYEIGYCYYMLDDPKGIEYLKRYVEEYPQPDLFQLAVMMLLEYQLKRSLVYDALVTYQKVRPVIIHDSDGEIIVSYYRILTDIYKRTGKVYNIIIRDILREINYFLTNYKDVPKYPDILLLKGKLHYKYLDKELGEKIFKRILDEYPHRDDLKKEIRAISEYGKGTLL